MKRLVPLFVLLLLVLAAGVAYAKPGDGPNSYLVIMDCGSGSFDVLVNANGAAGHLPDGTIVKPRSNTGILAETGEPVFLFDHPGQGYQTVACTWTIPAFCPSAGCPFASFFGDVQFSPPS